MTDLPEQSQARGRERAVGKTIDVLRRVGARPLTNAMLGILRRLGRAESPHVAIASAAARRIPDGPFTVADTGDAPALLLFVPRSLRSRLIDGATGGYGYSHLAVDCGEIDQPSGKRVMIESAPGQPVRRSYQDEYGARPFVRIPLAGRGIDPDAFCTCVKSKVGEAYDEIEALTWGEVDDPAKQICSDLAAVCLPPAMLEDMAGRHAAGKLPRRSVSAYHRGTPQLHAFVSPNGFAAYFGAPPGERLSRPGHLAPMRRKQHRGGREMRAKLIFNPAAGSAAQSATQLTQILTALQRSGILPEVHLVTPDSSLEAIAADALRRGIRMVIVSGGDGTVDSVMAALVGTGATLGIIPTGTRNNIAFSLGIPADVAGAVELLREGERVKVDVGQARCNGVSRWFLEAGAVGLASALYPAADQLQHGALDRVGELVTTFVSATPSHIRLTLDSRREILVDAGHLVLLANMPYFGPHFHPVSDIAYDDGRLDVLVFGQLSKLDLLSYAILTGSGTVDDPRVEHYRARRVEVYADPPMPAMVDGVMLGEGPLRVTVRAHGLAVMAGRRFPVPKPLAAAEQPDNEKEKT